MISQLTSAEACDLNDFVAMTLVKDLIIAWTLYLEKRDYFVKLCEVHSDRVPEWYSMNRQARVHSDGVINSVFRHSSSKGNAPFSFHWSTDRHLAISLQSISERLLKRSTPSADSDLEQSVYFVMEGISIQTKQ